MDFQENFKNPLISIPPKKIETAINKILSEGRKSASDGVDDLAAVKIETIHRYADANIPVDYWERDMFDFKGDKALYKSYNNITSDINKSYDEGVGIVFAGKHGTGKTLTSSCILKRAVEKGYSALYTTLESVVSLMACSDVEGKYASRQVLMSIDFLVLDEFDPRFMGSANAADLYGRILEPTLRHRIQNNLPVIMCTNSPKVTDSFSGPLHESISSLMKLVKIIPVLGQDFRAVKDG